MCLFFFWLCGNVCIFHKDDTMKGNDIQVLISINENCDSFFYCQLSFSMTKVRKKKKTVTKFPYKIMKRLSGRKA